MLICGHLWGLHITATTAIYDNNKIIKASQFSPKSQKNNTHVVKRSRLFANSQNNMVKYYWKGPLTSYGKTLQITKGLWSNLWFSLLQLQKFYYCHVKPVIFSTIMLWTLKFLLQKLSSLAWLLTLAAVPDKTKRNMIPRKLKVKYERDN